ncbi:MAG: hypothetical protein AAF756_17575 [Pseudomonadota bacterium]
MSKAHATSVHWFSLVKYLTYGLLLANVYLFLQEELGSLAHTSTGSLSLTDFVQVFAQTIDTAAWVILLLLFELETSILDDEQLTPGITRLIHGTRLVCGAAIVWAFLGYGAELTTLYSTYALDAWDACSHVAEQWSILLRLDDYEPLTATNCASLGDTLARVSDYRVVAQPEGLRITRQLAWADFINSGTWIQVVLLLEIEVRLQESGRLSNTLMRGALKVKYLLYGILFAAAVYWGFEGKFLDFWDASLWLFAFIFIELNIFEWQQSSEAPLKKQTAS